METTLSPEIATAARRTRKGTPDHPIEFRRELAKLACEPSVLVARLALEHGLNTNLLFKPRRAYQAGQYEPATLLPVEVAHDERTIENAVALSAQSQNKAQLVVAGVIEISVGVARVHIEGVPGAARLIPASSLLRRIENCFFEVRVVLYVWHVIVHVRSACRLHW
ncbi:transposase [Paraburkholderia strydomiana]|uniref:transposase n=1 Tax=Paraburkholderia strydomiana TaxID=1245417 RepID=UPI0038B7AF20